MFQGRLIIPNNELLQAFWFKKLDHRCVWFDPQPKKYGSPKKTIMKNDPAVNATLKNSHIFLFPLKIRLHSPMTDAQVTRNGRLGGGTPGTRGTGKVTLILDVFRS